MEKECFSIPEVERGIYPALPSPGREDMGQCNLRRRPLWLPCVKRLRRTPTASQIQNHPLPRGPWEVPTSGFRPWCTPLVGRQPSRTRSHHPGDAGSPAKSTWVPQHTCWAPLPGEPRSTPWRGGVGPGMMAALETAPPRYSTETPASALIRQWRQYWSSEMSSILLFSFLLLDFQCVFIINHIPPFPGGCSFPSEKAIYKQTSVPPFLVEMPSTTLPLTSGFCKVT